MSTKKQWHGCQGIECDRRDSCARFHLRETASSGPDNLCIIAQQLGDPAYSMYDNYNERPVQRIVPQSEWVGAPIAARSSASIFWMAAA